MGMAQDAVAVCDRRRRLGLLVIARRGVVSQGVGSRATASRRQPLGQSTPNGLDELRTAVVELDFTAQGGHATVDAPRTDENAETPSRVQKLIPREDAPRMLAQANQSPEALLKLLQ